MPLRKPLLQGIILALLMFSVLLGYNVVSGEAAPVARALPAAIFVAALGTWSAWRTSRQLDPYPTWLILTFGIVGVGFYGFWIASAKGPATVGELVAVVLLACVPIGLVIYGMRQLRNKP